MRSFLTIKLRLGRLRRLRNSHDEISGYSRTQPEYSEIQPDEALFLFPESRDQDKAEELFRTARQVREMVKGNIFSGAQVLPECSDATCDLSAGIAHIGWRMAKCRSASMKY